MPGAAKQIRHELTYRFARIFITLFNIIPRDLAVFIGASLGLTASLILKKDMRKARRHLSLVYRNGRSGGWDEAIARRMFINFGKNLADTVRFKKHLKEDLIPYIEVEGIEHFEEVYNRGRGMIAVTGHVGNFELLAAWSAAAGYKSAAIGRELYEKRIDRLLVENREAVGVVNIATEDSPRKILRLLKDGYALGVLIDTDSFRVRSKLIPFLGRLSNTPVGQSVLGLKTGAGFVPIACVRNGKNYKIIIKPEQTIERTGNFEKDLYNITERCTKVLEEIVTEYKDQWIWLHNRWHTRREGNDDRNDDEN
jgi:KDO2-lipid IV(A) lauroyltransferase